MFRAAAPFPRALARHASSSATEVDVAIARRTSPFVVAFRTFVFGLTLVAVDAAVDDVVLLRAAKSLARAHTSIARDDALRAALGEDYDDDGEWWNASVARFDRGRAFRACYRLRGSLAACDVVVECALKTENDFARGERSQATSMSSLVMNYVPKSFAHAIGGAEMFTLVGVDAALPSARGGGRAALTSLTRIDRAQNGRVERRT